jgi:hypothetical protein
MPALQFCGVENADKRNMTDELKVLMGEFPFLAVAPFARKKPTRARHLSRLQHACDMCR